MPVAESVSPVPLLEELEVVLAVAAALARATAALAVGLSKSDTDWDEVIPDTDMFPLGSCVRAV